MLRTAPRLRILAGAGLLALGAAACGGSSGHLSASNATTTTTGAQAPTSSTTASGATASGGPASTSTTAAGGSTGSAILGGSSSPTTTTHSSAGGTAAGSGSSAPGGALGSGDTHTPSASLTGAGANSIQPFFARVFYDYQQANHSVTVNYSPAGSSVGVSDIQQQTVDFGDTEIPMSSSDIAKAKGGNVLQVPVDLGGVSLSYNVPGVGGGLHLNADVVARIFLGKITNWNDSAIAALNPSAHLPDLSIVPVHRADSSGPGWDLDDYLIKGSPTWVSAIGTSSPSKSWPESKVGVGQQLNTGVASYIAQNQGAIGYVEYSYALQAGFSNVALQNAAGDYVAPTEATIANAGSNATSVSATNFDIVDSPGANTYALANFSWTLLYQKQSDANKGITLGRLFDWVTTSGQSRSSALGYAPLPSNIVNLAHQTLLQLQDSSGHPLFS